MGEAAPSARSCSTCPSTWTRSRSATSGLLRDRREPRRRLHAPDHRHRRRGPAHPRRHQRCHGPWRTLTQQDVSARRCSSSPTSDGWFRAAPDPARRHPADLDPHERLTDRVTRTCLRIAGGALTTSYAAFVLKPFVNVTTITNTSSPHGVEATIVSSASSPSASTPTRQLGPLGRRPGRTRRDRGTHEERALPADLEHRPRPDGWAALSSWCARAARALPGRRSCRTGACIVTGRPLRSLRDVSVRRRACSSSPSPWSCAEPVRPDPLRVQRDGDELDQLRGHRAVLHMWRRSAGRRIRALFAYDLDEPAGARTAATPPARTPRARTRAPWHDANPGPAAADDAAPAYTLNGSTSFVSTPRSYANPTTFSEGGLVPHDRRRRPAHRLREQPGHHLGAARHGRSTSTPPASSCSARTTARRRCYLAEGRHRRCVAPRRVDDVADERHAPVPRRHARRVEQRVQGTENYTGYFRIGYDTISGWPGARATTPSPARCATPPCTRRN